MSNKGRIASASRKTSEAEVEKESTSTSQKMKNTALRISRPDVVRIEQMADKLSLTPSKIIHIIVKGIIAGALK